MASFKVITSSDIEEFEKNVNEYVDKRWLIINCSSVRSASSDDFIFHAFLKKTEFRRDSSFGGRSGDRNRGGDRGRGGDRDRGRSGDRDRGRSGDRNRDYRPRRDQGDRRDGKDRRRETRDTAPRTAGGEKNKYPKGYSDENRTRSKTTFDSSKTKKLRHEKRSDD